MNTSLRLIILLLSTSQTMAGSSNNKIKLRSSVYHFPPMMYMKGDDKNFTLSGFCYDAMNLLSDILNLEFTYVLPKSSKVEKYGLAPSTIQQLLNNEVDIVPYLFANTGERNRMMDITFPIIFENYYILFAKSEESSVLNIAKPFQYEVWLTIAAATAVLLAVKILSHKIDRLHHNPKRPGNSSIVIKNETRSFKSRHLVKFSLGIWGLMTTILTNAYTTNIISFLTIPRSKPVPNTYEELAKDSSIKLTIEKDFVMTQVILNATSGPLKIIGDDLRRNPHLMTESSELAVANILKNGNAYIATQAYIVFVVSNDMRETGGKCRYTLSKPLLHTNSFSFGLRKNGPYNAIIKRKLLHIFESRILFDHIYGKYITNIDKCTQRETKKAARVDQLKLKDLSGAFIFLLIGVAISFLCFLIEFGIALRRNALNRHPPAVMEEIK